MNIVYNETRHVCQQNGVNHLYLPCRVRDVNREKQQIPHSFEIKQSKWPTSCSHPEVIKQHLYAY